MPFVKRLRRRGVNLTVEAHGELLFVPGGEIAQWNRRLSNQIRRYAALSAPSNKRPRWAHYGKPLKQTMRASTDSDPSTMTAHAAIGSTAPYAGYVDQGTGIYGGNGPYQAKILPPWTRGSPSLYESTWVPPGSRERRGIGTVTVKGQKGQFFFDAALRKALRSMRVASVEVPGEVPALRTFPDHLADFVGNTPVDAGFIAQLQEWRSWRDAAFNTGRLLGKDTQGARRRRTRRSRANPFRRRTTAAERRAANARRQARWRERHRDQVQEYNRRRRVKDRKDMTSAKQRAAAEQRKRSQALQAALNREANQLRAALQAKGIRVVSMNRVQVNGVYQWRITALVKGVPKTFTNKSGIQKPA